MWALLEQFFEGDFMPHGHCYFWRPDILWSNVIGDGITALAYFSIPFLLLIFIQKRKDLEFKGIFYFFVLFILSCGITHTLTIVSVWQPIYAIEGIAKLATGAISILTAVVLFRAIPKALKIPSPSALENVNNELKEQILYKKNAEKSFFQKSKDLQKSNATLKQVIESTSHDLKEPLRNIIINAQSYMRNKDRKEEELNQIIEESKRMLSSLEGLENIEKIEERSAALPPQKIDFNKCIDAALKELKIDKKQIDLKSRLPDWYGFSGLVKDALKEVIDNAFKFNRNKNVKVAISHEIKEGVLVLKISDNGIGFDMKYKQRIFEMFEKLHDRNRYPGPGLGLATCWEIMRIHNGKIDVESEIKKGSTFIMYFPDPSILD